MGLPSVDEAMIALARLGLPANFGNPGRVMPHLKEPIVAVNLEKTSATSRTMVAYVCGPKHLGQIACGQLATQVAMYWEFMGAQCTYGQYSFDGKAAIHIVTVYGTWTATEEPAE